MMNIYPFEDLSLLGDANPTLRDLLRSSMSSDERIVLGYYYRHEGDTQVAVLTDRRVIAGYVRGGFGKMLNLVLPDFQPDISILDLPLQDVSSINQSRNPRVFRATPELIELTGYDESKRLTFFFPSRDEFYHRMLTLLRESVDRARSRKQRRSPSDRLRELAALRDDGLITEEEFQSKRSRIIEDL